MHGGDKLNMKGSRSVCGDRLARIALEGAKKCQGLQNHGRSSSEMRTTLLTADYFLHNYPKHDQNSAVDCDGNRCKERGEQIDKNSREV